MVDEHPRNNGGERVDDPNQRKRSGGKVECEECGVPVEIDQSAIAEHLSQTVSSERQGAAYIALHGVKSDGNRDRAHF